MSQSLNIAVLHLHAEMRENGVGGIRLIGTEQRTASQDVDVVTMLCAAFGKHHIVVIVFFVYVWPLWIASAETRSQVMDIACTLACMNVNLADVDFTRFDTWTCFVCCRFP